MWALLAQDVFELAGGADGEQQRPGQQSVGVELARLRGDGGTGPVRSGVGAGEQALEALHCSLHILKRAGDSSRHREAEFPPSQKRDQITSSPEYRLLRLAYRGPGWWPPVRGTHLLSKDNSRQSISAAPHTHRLSGLDVGRSVRQDGFEDRFQGLEHLLAFDARAQLDAQEAGQRSCRPLLLTFAWHKRECESALKRMGCAWVRSSPGTFLEAAFDAVRDGHPPLGDELVEDARGHCRLEPVQRPLSGLCAEETNTHDFYATLGV